MIKHVFDGICICLKCILHTMINIDPKSINTLDSDVTIFCDSVK